MAIATSERTQTPFEVLSILRRNNPGARLVLNKAHSAIGRWLEDEGRYQPVFFLTLDGYWARLQYELLIDGVRMPFLADETL